MTLRNKPGRLPRSEEKGQTLILVAVALVSIIGMAALAIDVVTLYTFRSEAQRSADAGALAGAKIFADAGFTSGACPSPLAGTVKALATQAATAIAQQNNVNLQSPNVTVTSPNGTGPGCSVNPRTKSFSGTK